MASGLPVVASRAGGIPKVVVDGETGFLCEPEDVVGMAAAALKLLSDEGLYRAFSEAGRRRAVERFSEEQVVPRYLEAYEWDSRELKVGREPHRPKNPSPYRAYSVLLVRSSRRCRWQERGEGRER